MPSGSGHIKLRNLSSRLTLALLRLPIPNHFGQKHLTVKSYYTDTCLKSPAPSINPLALISLLPLASLSLSLAPSSLCNSSIEEQKGNHQTTQQKMGKLICDSTTSSPVIPWKDPTSAPPPSLDSIGTVDLSDQISTAASPTWENVSGLEDQQRRNLQRLHTKGVLWKHPGNQHQDSVVFRLSHGGDVEADGNCLFTASHKAMGLTAIDAKDLRRRTVRRFLEDLGSVTKNEREMIDAAIKHMYCPDLKSGWGIHVVQELKLLAKKEDREDLDSAVNELLHFGMQRELAAESIYRERCTAVEDGSSWATYMSISGSPDDEYDIISLQYTEEGLLTVDENREGHAAAFGDDIAIECLATEFKREIYVVQAHGSDAMVDEENCVFFLPHRPRSEICGPPFFLFMKGTGWCAGGADHYEPIVAHPSSLISQEKVAMVL